MRSRRMDACTPVAVLRDARKSALLWMRPGSRCYWAITGLAARCFHLSATAWTCQAGCLKRANGTFSQLMRSRKSRPKAALTSKPKIADRARTLRDV